MPDIENRHDVIQGLKDKSVKGIKYVLNNSLPEGYIYIMGTENMIKTCGYDSSEIFNVPRPPKAIKSVEVVKEVKK